MNDISPIIPIYRRDFLIARIDSGCSRIRIKDKPTLIVRSATKDLLYEAQEVYVDVYEQSIEDGLLTVDECVQEMVKIGLWDSEQEDNYKNILPKHLDYWKENLYRSRIKPSQLKSIRLHLEKAKEEYKRLGYERHQFFHYTVEGSANYSRIYFVVENTTFYEDGTPYDWKYHSVDEVIIEINKDFISEEAMRELARTEPWKSMWFTRKVNNKLFDGLLTSEQQRLISWSSLYENVVQSVHPPEPEVINDDDMLDGYLLVQSKEREAANRQNPNSRDKIGNSDEVFIKAHSWEDAKKIAELNPDNVKRIKQNRMAALEEAGEIEHHKFGDVAQKLRMQINRDYAASVKGRK